MDLFYRLRSGKNNKLLYFVNSYAHEALWHGFYRSWRSILREARRRNDFAAIMSRVNYYCKAPGPQQGNTRAVRDFGRHEAASVYYFDLHKAMRPFGPDTQMRYLPGDVTTVPLLPTLTKSRPIKGDNANSVLLKLNAIRHFISVRDTTPFSAKKDAAVFRGKVMDKPKRMDFFNRWFGHPLCDAGDTSRAAGHPEWKTDVMTIAQQLGYKFILAIEGNDVSSNLKWIMNSRSVAMMPEPEYETWFMEGRLRAGEHYIRLNSDFSDFEEVMEYYLTHQAEAEAIAANARRYCEEFHDRRREYIISTLTVAKYLGLLDPADYQINS